MAMGRKYVTLDVEGWGKECEIGRVAFQDDDGKLIIGHTKYGNGNFIHDHFAYCKRPTKQSKIIKQFALEGRPWEE
jgi:hypothetical protein